jgi:tetratricopeptide (TPR) repeat protein
MWISAVCAILLTLCAPVHAQNAAEIPEAPDTTNGPTAGQPERLDLVLVENPGHVVSRLERARSLEKLGETDAAMADYTWLMEHRPDLPHAFNNAARLLASKGKHQEAIKLLERGIATDPIYATMFSNLREIFASLASRAYRAALEEPDSPDDVSEIDEPLVMELKRVEPTQTDVASGSIGDALAADTTQQPESLTATGEQVNRDLEEPAGEKIASRED